MNKLRKIDIVCLFIGIVQILLVILAQLDLSKVLKVMAVVMMPVTIILIILSNKKTKSNIRENNVFKSYDEWENSFNNSILSVLNINEDIKEADLVAGEIYLFSKNQLLKEQIGYVYDLEKNMIKDWIGENYVVIGHDSTCGDPIILDISNEKFPIYSMFHDDWSTLEKIADSYDEFLKIIKIIKKGKLNLNTPIEKRIEVLNKIAVISSKSLNYWESSLGIEEEEIFVDKQQSDDK